MTKGACFNSGYPIKDHFGDVTVMVEFLGIREQLNNPSIKPVEFDGFRVRTGDGL
jgi:hypothetical protein